MEKGRDARLWVIGDPAFIKRTLHAVHQRRLRIRKWGSEGPDFVPVTKKVCHVFKIDPDRLFFRHRGGPASLARKAFAYMCVRRLEIPTKTVAQYLKISPGAVSNMLGEGEKIVSVYSELCI